MIHRDMIRPVSENTGVMENQISNAGADNSVVLAESCPRASNNTTVITQAIMVQTASRSKAIPRQFR